ncbi:MAG TPA: hypothetical protein VGJ09_09810, partial [Bryobacteraceae bacterium]
LDHFLLVTGCLCFVHFAQSASKAAGSRWLAAGSFALGWGLWNKATFVWELAGLAGAALIVCRPEVRQRLNLKTGTVAMAAFLAGALPLVIYNLKRPNATLGSSAHIEIDKLGDKLLQLRNTMDGSALFGFVVAEEWADQPAAPASLLGRNAVWIRNHLGEHRRNAMVWALGLCLLAMPVWWRSRAARYSLAFMAITWISMGLTRDAGGSAHHAVLLWPFPQLFVAATVASLGRPRITAVAGIFLIGANLLVINQYIAQMERNGPEGYFTDAVYTLSRELGEAPGQNVYVIDWGMQNTLDLLHQGRLKLKAANDAFMTDAPNETDRRTMDRMFADSSGLFVGHVPQTEAFPGVGVRFNQAIEAAGYRKDARRVIADSHGRPVFEIFRLTHR